ncbi:putative NRPS-like protein biosynthetic cluster [Claviceps citrina]|nr:putative NRPS-like protein biosynthetic cluster [Claviceps citrina]
MASPIGTQGISTLSQLFRQRALDQDQTPLLAFPRSRNGVADFERLSGAALYRLINGAARSLVDKGFPAVDPNEEVVVGVCSPTDLDYLVTIFALIQLGYIPMQISPRLAPGAMAELLQLVQKPGHRRVLLHGSSLAPEKLHQHHQHLRQAGLELHPLLTRPEYDRDVDGVPLPLPVPDKTGHAGRHDGQGRCIILHSSGSTGLPRPIDYSHRKLLAAASYAQDATAFITLPFSHALGMMSYMQAFTKRRTAFAMSGHVPQTHETVTAALAEAKPDIVWTVPYVLKLLAERPDGIEALRRCRFVSSGGSRLPDELGDLLTEHGVHIGMQFGSTETGLLMSSAYRPRHDKAWNYLRPPPHVLPYVRLEPVEQGKYECVVLEGHKGKTMSNSDEPEPNSWRTGDLFEPHPLVPNAWKFVSRMDDRIALINGEKVLPLTFESRVRQHPLVREAVMFGIDRDVPGLLLFRAVDAPRPEALSDEQFLDLVWPAVSDANSRAESFAQVMREMVVVVPATRECPTTDKSSVKRAQVYREFAADIDAAYEAMLHGKAAQSLRLSGPELEDWILAAARAQGYAIRDADADFFSAGMDSLQATRLRGQILRNVHLGGHEDQCTAMIAFECGNARNLAARLGAIRAGNGHGAGGQVDESSSSRPCTGTVQMQALIDKYSSFSSSSPPSPANSQAAETVLEPDRKTVMLTGATGFLGSHLLAALLATKSIDKIYALIRPHHHGQNGTATASSRLAAALKTRGFGDLALDKVVCVYHDLARGDNLGIEPPHLHEALKTEVTHIIHCAWPVNFTLPLATFEPHIAGLHNLLSLCVQSRHRVRLQFCSSIAVAQSTQGPATVPSEAMPSLETSGRLGYAQSKLVGERIVAAAVKRHGVSAMVLRIGQIVPGRRRGARLWNPNEAIPLMIRAAMLEGSIASLPVLSPGRDACDWIEADTLADTMVQLAGLQDDAADPEADSCRSTGNVFYNLVNPRVFSWERDLLPALRDAGLIFDVLPWEEWLDRLANSNDDLALNPSKKLLGFWREQAQRQDALRFDTAVSEAASSALRQSLRVLDDGFMGQIVEAWRRAA